MPLIFKKGSILDSQEQYLAHQTNCVSTTAGGLANTLFEHFRYSNIYLPRHSGNRDKPGQIVVSGNGLNQRFIVHMMGQVYPGKPRFSDSNYIDSYSKRKHYFNKCLDDISKLPNLTSVAFPFKIGCGLAGGVWQDYLDMLEAFSNTVSAVQVVIWQNE